MFFAKNEPFSLGEPYCTACLFSLRYEQYLSPARSDHAASATTVAGNPYRKLPAASLLCQWLTRLNLARDKRPVATKSSRPYHSAMCMTKVDELAKSDSN